MIDLDELEYIARAADEGPWHHDADNKGVYSKTCLYIAEPNGKKNAEFIAAFNPSLAQELIRRLREAEHIASTSRQEAIEGAVSIIENIALHSEPDDFALDALNEAVDKIRMIE